MLQNAKVTFFLTLFYVCSATFCLAQTIEIRGFTMGPIPFKVLVVTDKVDKQNQELIQSKINQSLQRVNELMSTYLPDSDISRFNQAASNQWIDVDAETFAVVSKAIEISKLTEGAFDPTIGPAVNRWNFGPNKKKIPQLPSEEQIQNLQTQVGYQKIEIRSNPPAIRKLADNVRLDLSAIAKGYAVDRVGLTLRDMGYENSMVEVGGEVATSGHRSSGGPWNVAIDNPEKTSLDPIPGTETSVIQLSGNAVATSGDYRNFVEIDGKQYSHTIDPKTCRPVDHKLSLASIVADDCMTADAIATAVMVMGLEKGKSFCKKNGYPLLAVTRSNSRDEASLIKFVSDDFPVRSVDQKNQPQQTMGSEAVESSEGDSIIPVFVATFAIFLLMVLGMAVGAIFNNKPVTGSCGGIANMQNENGESVCGVCSKPTTDCTERA